MVAAFTSEQWRKVLGDYFKLLKPGGYLQLLEFDSQNIKYGPWGTWARRWFFELSRKRNINLNIAADLPRLLEELGFTLISRDKREPTFPTIYRNEPMPNAFAQWYINTCSALSSKARQLYLGTQEEWAEFQQGIKKEATELKDSKDVISTPIFVFVAQVRMLSPLHQYKARAHHCWVGTLDTETISVSTTLSTQVSSEQSIDYLR